MLEAGKLRAVDASTALPRGGLLRAPTGLLRAPAGLLRAPTGLLRAPAGLLLLAAALALFLFGEGGVGQAQATQTLVSNTGQGSDHDYTSVRTRGQAFTTGYNLTGYTVTSVTIVARDNGEITLQVCEVGSDDAPTEACTGLIGPGVRVGPRTFTAPANTTLSSRTTYMVVLKFPGSGEASVGVTTSDHNDSASRPYWSIRNRLQVKWPALWADYGADAAIRIAIEGTVNPPSTTAPTTMDSTVTATEDTAYTFTATDFNFSATTGGDTLASVQILTLPARGQLRFHPPGSDSPVVVHQTVSKAALDSGYLTYHPPANGYGSGYASFAFKVIGNTETSTAAYLMTVDVTNVNDLPTGLPTISGIPEGRRTLTVSTAGIADVDGLTGVVYRYQWKRYAANGALEDFEGDIGADSSTYTLTEGDVGKKVRLKLAFEDDDGGSERLFSAVFPPTGTVGSPVLVSTTEQAGDVHSEVTVDRGQAFTTGRNVSGYNVTGVTIESKDPERDNVTLQICEVDRDGNPTTTCWDLNAPTRFVAGPLTFNVPSDTPITPTSLTTYMAVLKSPGGENLALVATSSSAEDAASLPDWSMRHGVRVKLATGWSLRTPVRALRMTIRGTANAASSTGPTAMDSSVATTEDTPYTFAAADFNFVATTLGDTLASVRIHTLPADGTLALNGVDLTAAQSVTRTQLNAGQLVYRPADNAFGAGYAAFQFIVSGNSEASPFAYRMTIDVSAVNDAATGAPAISGTAQVGETLTASTDPHRRSRRPARHLRLPVDTGGRQRHVERDEHRQCEFDHVHADHE